MQISRRGRFRNRGLEVLCDSSMLGYSDTYSPSQREVRIEIEGWHGKRGEATHIYTAQFSADEMMQIFRRMILNSCATDREIGMASGALTIIQSLMHTPNEQ